MRLRSIGVAVAALSFLIAGPAISDPDKCQKAISKEVVKAENKIAKALTKCADFAQKEIQKAEKGDLVKGGASCDKQLDKAINVSNTKSAIAKGIDKLAQAGPSDKVSCTDAELYGLGHLPENVFGTRWQRIAMLSAWQAAWAQAQLGNSTLSADLQELQEAGGCSFCNQVVNPPCFATACGLGGGTGGSANGIPLNFAGSTISSVCDAPTLMDAGESAVVSFPNRGLAPLEVLPTLFACVQVMSTVGVSNCDGGALPSVDTDVCVDHIVAGGVDECETGAGTAQFCADDVDDPDHGGVVNGGTCITLTAGAPVVGSSFVLSTSRIQIVAAAEYGADGLPCTSDDTPASVTAAATQANTTGSASALVIDADNNDAAPPLTAGPVSGTPFNCGSAAQAVPVGATVNSFSALHALLGLDQVVDSTFECN